MRKGMRCGVKVLFLLVLLLTAGCGLADTMNKRQAGKDFIDANRNYMLKLRWSDYPGAAMAYQPELRQTFVDRFRTYTNIRITDVETLQATPDLEKGEALVNYRLEFYRLNKAQVRTYDWSQTWVMNEAGDWQIDQAFADDFPPK